MAQRTELAERGSGAVVVAVSGSDSDLLTVPEAAHGALRIGARLLVVHVIGALGRDADGEVDEARLERLADDGEAVVERGIELARAELPELVIDDALLSGDRVTVLGAISARSHRLYVGTSETSSVRPMVPGQVTVGITTTASCPVFLVRGARGERGGRVLVYLDRAREVDVISFAVEEARSLGLSVTILQRGPIGETWPVEDVPIIRILVPEQQRAQQLLSSPRNDLLVVSAADLDAERSLIGPAGLRRRYAGIPGLVAVVPESQV